MATVVAVEAGGGVAIAGDSRAVDGGTVTSDSVDRVFGFDGVGAGAVGGRAGVDEFERELDAELRSERFDADDRIEIEWLARVAARLAADAGVEAVVAAPDADGTARLRRVGSDGAVTEGPVAALGSGAAVALGRLEAADLALDVEGAATLVRDVLETTIERDPETGGDVDVWTLPDGSETNE